jgi:hypothetical protein
LAREAKCVSLYARHERHEQLKVQNAPSATLNNLVELTEARPETEN